MEFDHIGIVTEDKKSDENFVEETRVWVTNPKDHPFNVEWLRFEPDTPVTGPLRRGPHVAYRVDSVDEASKGLKVLLEPWVVNNFVRVGFFLTDDDVVVEFMEYLHGDGEWFPEDEQQ
jgi:hypothetical protein